MIDCECILHISPKMNIAANQGHVYMTIYNIFTVVGDLDYLIQ